jgi:hypothetical protein
VVVVAIVAAQAIAVTGLIVGGVIHLAIGVIAAGLIALVVVRPWARARALVAATAPPLATVAPGPAGSPAGGAASI